MKFHVITKQGFVSLVHGFKERCLHFSDYTCEDNHTKVVTCEFIYRVDFPKKLLFL